MLKQTEMKKKSDAEETEKKIRICGKMRVHDEWAQKKGQFQLIWTLDMNSMDLRLITVVLTPD